MEHPSLTPQTTAIFKSINNLRIPLAVGREDSQSNRLSGVRALGPRLREDDGTGHDAALVSVQRAWTTKSYGDVTEEESNNISVFFISVVYGRWKVCGMHYDGSADEIESSGWHGQILKERRKRIKAGDAEFVSIVELKKSTVNGDTG